MKNDDLLYVGIGLGALVLFLLSRSAQASVAPAAGDSVGSAGVSPLNWIETMTTGQTRGERNNNPGNIRHGIDWQGLAADQPDSNFATFVNADYGIRALAKNLHNYYVLHGLDTVASIVMRWAPPPENDTTAYINAVSSTTGFDPYAHLDMNDPNVLASLAAGIINQENGRVAYDPAVIANAAQAAIMG